MTERVRWYISIFTFAFMFNVLHSAAGVDGWGLAVSLEAGDAVLDSCDHPAGSIVWQMEADRVIWKMVGSAKRPDGCRRRADVPAERKAMRRTALHAALHQSSFGHEEAVAGRAGAAWELVRRNERRLGRLGRVAGRDPGIGWLPRRRGSHHPLKPRAALFPKRASVLSKEPRLRATGSTLNTLFSSDCSARSK